MADIEPQEVREHLEKIAASKGFAESERLRRFLRFTVESKLGRQHERVKEYVLGREVFDRQDDYDPRVDPIVRVEARRLRSKLDEYYSGPGRAEPIRIEYAKGSYLPVFQRVQPAWKNGRVLAAAKFVLAGAAVAAIVIAAVVAAGALRQPQPMLAVIPARWIEPNPGDLNASDVSLAEAVDAELANRGKARVLAWPLIVQHQHDRKPLQELASALGAGKIVLIIVRDVPSSKRVTAFLMDAQTGQKLRAADYFTRNISTYDAQHALAGQIASDLAKLLPG